MPFFPSSSVWLLLHEIIDAAAGAFAHAIERCAHRPLLALHRVEDAETAVTGDVQTLVDHHQARYVSAAVTIVWRRPHRHQILVWKHVLVAFLHQLMCSADQNEIVRMVELATRFVRRCSATVFKNAKLFYFCRDFAAEEPAGTAWTDCPCFDIVWVAPHQVYNAMRRQDLTLKLCEEQKNVPQKAP